MTDVLLAYIIFMFSDQKKYDSTFLRPLFYGVFADVFQEDDFISFTVCSLWHKPVFSEYLLYPPVAVFDLFLASSLRFHIYFLVSKQDRDRCRCRTPFKTLVNHFKIFIV